MANFYDETMEHRYVGATSGDHEAAGRLMQRMACQLELSKAQEKVANVDGAPWIRNQIEFHGLVDAIGLDFYHLRENMQKSRRIVFGEESAQGKAWLEEVMHTFRHVGYDAAWDQLVAWRSPLRSPTKRKEANRLMQYVAERKAMIRYPEFRRRGWQIGSGPTESECKTTTQRVKGRGRRWNGSQRRSDDGPRLPGRQPHVANLLDNSNARKDLTPPDNMATHPARGGAGNLQPLLLT